MQLIVLKKGRCQASFFYAPLLKTQRNACNAPDVNNCFTARTGLTIICNASEIRERNHGN